MKKLTNTETLFIRACKSSNPSQRIRSVYNRFYIKGEYNYENISFILISLYDKIRIKKDLFYFIYKLSPDSGIFKNGKTYWERVFNMIMMEIRYIESKDLMDLGFRRSLQFRKG